MPTMVALNTSTMMTMVALLLIGCCSSLVTTTTAFQTISTSTTLQRSSSSLHMAATGGNKAKSAPRFDKSTEKWIVTDPEVSFIYIYNRIILSAIFAFAKSHYILTNMIYRLKVPRLDMISSVVSTELDPSHSFNAYLTVTNMNKQC
jgi:hypothetical protein